MEDDPTLLAWLSLRCINASFGPILNKTVAEPLAEKSKKEKSKLINSSFIPIRFIGRFVPILYILIDLWLRLL